jgi:hypothetical protein
MVVGGTEEMISALKPQKQTFNSIDEVLKSTAKTTRKRGSKK